MAAQQDIPAIILGMERAALDRWGNGDPSGFLEISAPDVGYFDPHQSRRMDGHATLAQYYEGLRGKMHVDRDEIINPQVQVVGDAAVLTFNYHSWSGYEELYWHCTEVYARRKNRWQIIHTHWSYAR